MMKFDGGNYVDSCRTAWMPNKRKKTKAKWKTEQHPSVFPACLEVAPSNANLSEGTLVR
jgi:hypothetical protein